MLLRSDPHYEERREVIAHDAFMTQLAAAPIEEFRRIARDRQMRGVTHPYDAAYSPRSSATHVADPTRPAEPAVHAPAAKAEAAPASASAPAVSKRPPVAAPKVAQRDPAAEECAERQRLAATPGITEIERLAILASTTSIETARFMASSEYRSMLRASAPTAKPTTANQDEQARLDALFGIAPGAVAHGPESVVQTFTAAPARYAPAQPPPPLAQLPQPRTRAEAERAAKLDAEFGLAGDGNASGGSDPRVQTFGASSSAARRAAAPAAKARIGDDSLERELEAFRASAEAPHPFE